VGVGKDCLGVDSCVLERGRGFVFVLNDDFLDEVDGDDGVKGGCIVNEIVSVRCSAVEHA